MEEALSQCAPLNSDFQHSAQNEDNADKTMTDATEETTYQCTFSVSEMHPTTSTNGGDAKTSAVQQDLATDVATPQQPKIKSEPSSETKDASKSVEHKLRLKPLAKPNVHHEGRKTPYFESSTYTAIQELLTEEGALKWGRNVPQQLHELVYQLSSSLLDHAKSSAEHRDSTVVDSEDITEALDFFNKQFKFKNPEYHSRLQESVEKLNAEPLPKIRCEYGLHTPNERFMIIQPNYKIIDKKKDEQSSEPAAKLAHMSAANRSVPTNVYLSNIVEQTFINPGDAVEFD